MLGQLLDVLRLTPAHMTANLVVSAILGGLGLYEPLIVVFLGKGICRLAVGNSLVSGAWQKRKGTYYRCTEYLRSPAQEYPPPLFLVFWLP